MIDLKNNKILITGAHGFLGQHLLKKLEDFGVSPTQIKSPSREELDLRTKENCIQAVKNVDLVFHLAGTAGNSELHTAIPGQIYYDNLVMGIELMEAARKAGVKKFITIGSVAEYPDKTPLPYREKNLWEGIPNKIHLPYATAKKMLSIQAAAYRNQYGFNAVHLLLANMYGPGQSADSGVIPSLIKKSLEGIKNNHPTLEVWGSGNSTRDFIYVEDAALGIILAAQNYDKSEPVNISSGWEISIAELAKEILHATGFKGELKFNLAKSDDLTHRVVDPAKAFKEFGFTAKTDFKTGLQKTVDWYKSKNA